MAIVKTKVKLNDLNNSQSYCGIFIAPEVVLANAKEGTSFIMPLSSLPGVTDANYKAFIDLIGTGYMKKDDSAPGSKDYVVGNLILGGISTLYNNSSGGGNYAANVEFNSGIDLVEFRNYEKK